MNPSLKNGKFSFQFPFRSTTRQNNHFQKNKKFFFQFTSECKWCFHSCWFIFMRIINWNSFLLLSFSIYRNSTLRQRKRNVADMICNKIRNIERRLKGMWEYESSFIRRNFFVPFPSFVPLHTFTVFFSLLHSSPDWILLWMNG